VKHRFIVEAHLYRFIVDAHLYRFIVEAHLYRFIVEAHLYRFFIVCLHPIIKRGRVGIPFTCLTLPHFVPVLSKDLDFQSHMSWNILCSMV
jgi:hypothetical protein